MSEKNQNKDNLIIAKRLDKMEQDAMSDTCRK